MILVFGIVWFELPILLMHLLSFVAGILKETTLTNSSTPEKAKPTEQANERMHVSIFFYKYESPKDR